jgi:hypothetical protein
MTGFQLANGVFSFKQSDKPRMKVLYFKNLFIFLLRACHVHINTHYGCPLKIPYKITCDDRLVQVQYRYIQ